jgi:O-antigen ligase
MFLNKDFEIKKNSISPLLLALWLTIPNLLIFSSTSDPIFQELVFLFGVFIYLFVFGFNFYKISNNNLLIFLALLIPIILSFLFNFEKTNIIISVFNFLVFSYLLIVFSERNPLVFFNGLKFYSILNSIILLIIYILFSGVSEGRILIEGVQPNYIGLVCLTIALTSILFDNRLLKFLIYVFSLYFSYYISSRTTMMCLIFLGILIVMVKIKNKPKTLVFFLSSLVFVIFLYLDELFLFFNNIFMLDDGYRGLDSGFSGRTERWEIAFNIIKDNILFGIGFKTGEEALGFTTDNGYISVFLELGFWGIVNYLLIILMSSYIALKSIFSETINKEYKFCGFVVLVFCFYCFFEQRYINFGNSLSFMVFFSIFTLSCINFKRFSLND